MYFGNEDKTMLFLERLIDSANNELTIYITKSTKREPTIEENNDLSKGNDQLLKMLKNSTMIIPDYEELYKIYFENYIIYQTRNESFTLYDSDEVRLGQGLILFNKSKLLDHLYEFTPFISDDPGNEYPPGKWKHYGIYTANNIIDVISHKEPIIEKVKRTV